MIEPREDVSDLLHPLDGNVGPARRLSSARTAALAASIADRVQTEAAAPAAPSPAAIPRRRGRIALFAAAIVLASAAAAAATGAWLQTRDPVAATPTPSPSPSPTPSPAPSLAPPPAPPPAPVAAPEPPAAPPPRTRAEPAAPIDDLLAAANGHRKARRWRDAANLYEQVMRDHAGTDAAVVATVASASLRLDRLADPAGALRRFQRALRARPAGPLAEEARWGIAEAHRALGAADAERGALRAFVAAHPQSPRLPAATRRLAELADADPGAPR